MLIVVKKQEYVLSFAKSVLHNLYIKLLKNISCFLNDT